MRYRELVLEKVNKIESLFGSLNLSIGRGDKHSYDETVEAMKTLLADIYTFVDREEQE